MYTRHPADHFPGPLNEGGIEVERIADESGDLETAFVEEVLVYESCSR